MLGKRYRQQQPETYSARSRQKLDEDREEPRQIQFKSKIAEKHQNKRLVSPHDLNDACGKESTFERHSSQAAVQTPDHDSCKNGQDVQRYSRTPTAIESILSSSTPLNLDLKLFDNYKVASRLPPDIFRTICLRATQAEVSEFNATEGLPLLTRQQESEVQRLISQDVEYDENDNYYRQVWKFYLDNEQLLKEVQDTASDNLKALKRIYNIQNYYETSLLPKLFSYPKQYLE